MVYFIFNIKNDLHLNINNKLQFKYLVHNTRI